MLAQTLSPFAPSAHRIQGHGIGYAGVLSTDALRRAVPGAFAENAHGSRSERYAYVPTIQVIDGLQSAGYLPVHAKQATARDAERADHGKHLIRFRRADQLGAPEAREIVLKNSHDGSSAYEMSAGVFRLVCSNGLIVGNAQTTHKIRHTGNAVDDVIDVASRIVEDFELVTRDIELMKSVTLDRPQQIAFANAALAARFDTEQKPLTAGQVLFTRRQADTGNDVWTLFNRAQENLIKGGQYGRAVDAHGRVQMRRTREIKGIDQNLALNRALWALGVEMAKLAA